MVNRSSLPQLPLATPMFDKEGRLARPWIELFQSLAGPRFHSDRHTTRIESFGAGTLPVGTRYYETDRELHYVVLDGANGHVWAYQSGELSGLLANITADLGADDAGVPYYATDYERMYIWSGTAWQNAPGQLHQGAIAFFEADPGAGWGLANGATATYSTPTGGTSSKAKPNALNAYIRGAASYSASQVAANAPGISGSTAGESGHTHSVTVGGINTLASVDTDFFAVTTSGTQPFKNNAHTHPIPVQTVSSGAGSAHLHGVGTLAVDATAQPAHLNAIPYVRL